MGHPETVRPVHNTAERWVVIQRRPHPLATYDADNVGRQISLDQWDTWVAWPAAWPLGARLRILAKQPLTSGVVNQAQRKPQTVET